MILIVCPACTTALRVTGDHEEADSLVGQNSDFWPDKFECWSCRGKAAGIMELEFTSQVPLTLINVSPHEALLAVTGSGLPGERACDKVTVEQALREHPVLRIAGKDILGTQRVLIDYIELWDGSRVYLGASNEGAVVYKITRPHSYAAQVP